jgi:hypothetical protein
MAAIRDVKDRRMVSRKDQAAVDGPTKPRLPSLWSHIDLSGIRWRRDNRPRTLMAFTELESVTKNDITHLRTPLSAKHQESGRPS